MTRFGSSKLLIQKILLSILIFIVRHVRTVTQRWFIGWQRNEPDIKWWLPKLGVTGTVSGIECTVNYVILTKCKYWFSKNWCEIIWKISENMELNAHQALECNTIIERCRVLHKVALSQYQYDFASIGSKCNLLKELITSRIKNLCILI